jgi:GntR family transcriptional regulator, transcriptional repressor for pyruvate dehydrogenase complex
MAQPEGNRDSGGLFDPVAVTRASSAIVDQIRNAILTARVKQGDRLPPERELAAQFGVSRVTVRDALRALEATGLVEIRVGARGGAFVSAPTGSMVGQAMSDMMLMAAVSAEDVVEARLLVELGTVTLACARATEDDLEALRAVVDRARQELSAGTYARELSWEFHSLLSRMAHNPAIDSLTQSFRDSLSMHPVRVREPRARSFALTVEEHGRILEAVEKRDGDTARREMASHLLRGTGLERREAELLGLWKARGAARAPRKTRKG